MDHMDTPFCLNLQLFGESDAPTEGEVAPPSADNAPTEASQQPEPAERRFSQAEVDALIKSRLDRYKRDESKRIEEARSEAEKLARMSESERAEHERQQAEQNLQTREAEIARRESEIVRRELRAEAMETLAGKGLPKELGTILDYSSAETCANSLKTVEEAFRAAVQSAVESRLGGSAATIQRGTEKPPEAVSEAEKLALSIGKTNADANKAANDIIAKYI